MGSLRTFIAVEIPHSIQTSIQQQVDELRGKIGNSPIRWIPVKNIHLTLKFLGNVSQTDVRIITGIIHTEAESHSAFDITIGGLGSFPSSKRARVLFLGIQAPAALETLQRGIESACVKAGYRPETRPFSPHLTIGRVRRSITASDQTKIHTTLGEFKIDSLGTARVDSVHLFKSELRPSGAVYTKLFTAQLRNRGET
ncbi:MAG: RNA 2',3'-cyclic phosphodiesterase [Anaerolineales bacterium]|nr:RNA 2',3'-cyclic phosphodiesterase [Anaerolineales bacterium]